MTATRHRRRSTPTQETLATEPNWFSRVVSVLLSLSLFLAPSNLFFKFDQVNWAVRGLRIDYLLPKLYVSDVVVLVTLGLVLMWQRQQPLPPQPKWSRSAVLIFSSLVFFWLTRQFLTPYPIAAVSGAVRLISYAWLWWQVRLRWSELKYSWFWWALVLSLISQSALALFQFTTQHSLGSYRWLLGEPDLAHTYSIVHGSFGAWGELILPYGTTAHPNVLAGWVVGGWLLLLAWWRNKLVTQQWWSTTILFTTALLAGEVVWLTQSWSAAGLAITGLVWFGWTNLLTESKKIISLVQLRAWALILSIVLLSSPWWTKIVDTLPWLSLMTQRSLSWERRVWLSAAAIKLWQQQPWLGVGVNQFTAYLETVTHETELVRFVQPVHQVGWLWLSETGLLGVAMIGGLAWLIQQKDRDFWRRYTVWLWIALPILIWDHYLLTIPTGLWLSWWWLMPKQNSTQGSTLHKSSI